MYDFGPDRYSVIVNDEITGADEHLRTDNLEAAIAGFQSFVGERYVLQVVLLDLRDNKLLRTWSSDPTRTPQAALARHH